MPDRGQRTEDRGQKTEDRRQKTEDRRQRTEDRGQRTEDSHICDAVPSPDASRHPLPQVGKDARKVGEGWRFHDNERLGKLIRRPSSAFGTFSPEGRREGELGPSAPSPPRGKGKGSWGLRRLLPQGEKGRGVAAFGAFPRIIFDEIAICAFPVFEPDSITSGWMAFCVCCLALGSFLAWGWNALTNSRW
jgi:hypothetical protein